ncbi:hypothetical protein EDB19DRAFT_1832425 [Suillus lakei]|nr:hypothetical protein EDB19DRAFT_1832425 [Suillus lakei]
MGDKERLITHQWGWMDVDRTWEDDSHRNDARRYWLAWGNDALQGCRSFLHGHLRLSGTAQHMYWVDIFQMVPWTWMEQTHMTGRIGEDQNCGPIACSVLEQCLNTGLDEHGHLPLFQVQCGHKLRINMLHIIAGHIKKSCSDYHMLLDSPPDSWVADDMPDEEVINAIQNGRHQAECLELLQKLTIVSATCSTCQWPMITQDGDNPSHPCQNSGGTPVNDDGVEDDENEDEYDLGIVLPAERKARLAQLFKANNKLAGSRNCRRWLQDDLTFDDYEGGPTIEMLRSPQDINPSMTFQAGGMQLSTAWVDWVDHGYRIAPSAFHMFYQCDPIATMDHILPVGTSNSYDASNQVPDRVTGAYSLEWLGSDEGGQHTQVMDVEILSPSEIINSANYDPPLHDECRFGHDAFVRGHTSHRYGEGPAFYIDLEQDAIQFVEDGIETLVDIDSIIWTTKTFRCKGSIGIYVIPPFQMKPGIFKHNHTYVEITIPQSEEDANMPGRRTEWLSKCFPMSAIPHICIGHISSAASTLNLYIAFPRMIHKHPVNGRRITLMPQEVLDIFWDRVLLPSIGACTDVSWEPYLKHTLEEAQYKVKGMGGCTGGWGPPKSIPLIEFVMEVGKGIKLLTKDGQRGRFTGPEEALCCNLPDLDWPYMMDRSHGKLLIFQSSGVWRLDALEASFGAGGYKRGEMYHHNMLSRYGALQAEMQQERSQQTHIAFRSTYNLYYESIRTNSNQVNFASDGDAYKLAPSYMAECFQIGKVIDGCKEKTYGVRDEYRVSGHAARIILDNIESKAIEYMRSDPVLWISSKIWFDLMGCRELDLNSNTCLEAVQQVDDVNVLALMGVNAKAQRDRAVRRLESLQSAESELEDYPLG